jgi:hypothetical protein
MLSLLTRLSTLPVGVKTAKPAVLAALSVAHVTDLSPMHILLQLVWQPVLAWPIHEYVKLLK